MQAFRSVLNRGGFDLVRINVSQPERALPVLLKRLGVDLVLDIGANDGGYASTLRKNGFQGSIVSLEPTHDAFQRLQTAAARDPKWHCQKLALGPSSGEIEIHVAGNDGHSSSVLPMLPAHIESAPSSEYVGSETVPQSTLDAVYAEAAVGHRSPFLKLDVQGYEAEVLSAGEAALSSVVGIQLEVSLQPLYEGAPNSLEIVRDLEGRGFTTVQILRAFENEAELLQGRFHSPTMTKASPELG